MTAAAPRHGELAPSPEDITAFRKLVYDHYHAHPRPLPWRETQDPYAILVSEVMLQQTLVDWVAGKYAAFLDRFPHSAALARAPLDDVLIAWQGLGYNRRAVALKRCAETVMEHYGGSLPRSVEELEKLPGIGPYTARAVATFAFDIPTVFIETNIRTVFIHHFCGDRTGVTDRELFPLVEAALDRNDPRHWYYALMDYGVMVKKCHVNPGRRSAHHVRQSPFKGSNRELRSRILRAVLTTPGMMEDELPARLDADPVHVQDNLTRLVREGLLRRDADRLFIG